MTARSDDLEITTPSDRELVMTRVFDAPPHLVYSAWTDPQLVPQWWCCGNGFSMPVCEIDLRVGGRFRFVTRAPDGTEHPLVGEYREVAPPHRIVHTQRYDVEPYAKDEVIITLSFAARGAQTVFTSHALYSSKASRDGHLASMKLGVTDAFDRVAALVRTLAAEAA